MATLRFASWARANVLAGQRAVSHAITQRAKSAFRGNLTERMRGNSRKPCAAASSKAPRMLYREVTTEEYGALVEFLKRQV
jgi:hypothetical protein